MAAKLKKQEKFKQRNDYFEESEEEYEDYIEGFNYLDDKRRSNNFVVYLVLLAIISAILY